MVPGALLPIHPPTLDLVLVCLSLQAALALRIQALGHPLERGLRQAGLALLLQAAGLGFGLFLQGRTLPGLLSNLCLALILGGACLLYAALRLFYGRRVGIWIYAASALLTLLAVSLGPDGAEARFGPASLLVGLVALALARECARRTRDEVWPGPRWLCAFLFLFLSLVAIGRSLLPHLVPAGLLRFAALVVYGFLGLGMTLLLAQRLEARQRRFAQSDLLTGLLNRGGFEAYAARVLARARIREQFTSLLLLDVDHFSQIHRAHGHGAGDLVLETLGDLLHQQLRERDGAGRYEGDAFAVLLSETHDSFAPPVAERIRRAVEALEIAWEGHAIPVTVSIGVVGTGESGSDLEVLMQTAGERLARAKAGGRNRVVAV
ncbi:hypothetical protein GETHLI_04970 [Geothrix limicola]|uniref:diguanylate cyclase n=1 Tax=Geothrix limicola TaxID=2927978 RepID=A0ABQ5QB06_9BACT|nr:GGDEF domain-containing protein [Geothrix limicola]GLH71995.1 hypothetical protein GETHLI_04970 [Geothrix limicola]